MTTPWAIRTKNLTKLYRSRQGNHLAVQGLTLQVADGETVGFLGANGAGKTTTIKMLLNFIQPTSGQAWLYDVPCGEPRARQKVGYLPEQPYFPRFLTPRELLSAHATLAGVSPREAEHRIALALEMARADGFAHRPIGKLSKGMTQRVALAQALVGDPQLLILDEPASGLDPVSRVEMRNVLHALKEQGKTIFLSSHHLGEVELLCDRVAIIHQGRLLAFGTPEELVQQTDRYTLVAQQVSETLKRALRQIASHVRREGTQVVATIESMYLPEVLHRFARGEGQLMSLVRQRETLEEAFLRIVQNALPAAPLEKAA
ncbi:MAG: ABC transporter ATP-binding protein [bacterium]|nr:ABC transporter ATP-binding protein [bacterium]